VIEIAPRYLLDSNIAIYLLDGNAEPAARRLAERPKGEVVISAICLAEVRVKLEEKHEPGLARLLHNIPVVDFDSAAAAAYAVLPFQRGSFDRLIAAHAIARGLTVVTANEKDFADIPGLRVENWMQPA
jgi:tRNA(fMet)-specific endonuclease VapC